MILQYIDSSARNRSDRKQVKVRIKRISKHRVLCPVPDLLTMITTFLHFLPPPTKPPAIKRNGTNDTNKEVLNAAANLVTGLLVLFWILGFCCFCGLLWAIYFCCCGGRNGRGRTLSITARQPGQSYIKFIPDAVVEGAETGDSSYVEMK